MIDPSYASFLLWLRDWLNNPDAVRQFLREENERIDADVTAIIRRLYGDAAE